MDWDAGGPAAVVRGDGRPAPVLNDPELRRLIDFDEPVGLLMTAVLHFVADDADPWALVARYAGALAPGSYVALSHATYDRLPPGLVQASTEVYAQTAADWYPRPRAEVERLFTGLQIVPPYEGADPAVHPHRRMGRRRPRPCGQRWVPLVVRRGRPPSVTLR